MAITQAADARRRTARELGRVGVGAARAGGARRCCSRAAFAAGRLARERAAAELADRAAAALPLASGVAGGGDREAAADARWCWRATRR